MSPAHGFGEPRHFASAVRTPLGRSTTFFCRRDSGLRRFGRLTPLASAAQGGDRKQHHAGREYFHPAIPLANLYGNVSMAIPR
jgi:hypothetical protein